VLPTDCIEFVKCLYTPVVVTVPGKNILHKQLLSLKNTTMVVSQNIVNIPWAASGHQPSPVEVGQA